MAAGRVTQVGSRVCAMWCRAGSRGVDWCRLTGPPARASWPCRPPPIRHVWEAAAAARAGSVPYVVWVGGYARGRAGRVRRGAGRVCGSVRTAPRTQGGLHVRPLRSAEVVRVVASSSRAAAVAYHVWEGGRWGFLGMAMAGRERAMGKLTEASQRAAASSCWSALLWLVVPSVASTPPPAHIGSSAARLLPCTHPARPDTRARR